VLFSSTNQKLEYSAKQNIIIKKKNPSATKNLKTTLKKQKTKQNKTKRNQNIPIIHL